jgi:ribosomal protein S18 acetylase RimI-like enzyme
MNAELVVRPYLHEDNYALIELWKICFPNDPSCNNPADVIRRKLTVQPELLMVCLADGRLVGSVLAGFDGFRGWVNRVATHPEYQRQGIASLLMQNAENALAAMGCPKLNLQVRAGNAAVVEFYENAGYTIEDRISLGKHLD